MKLFSLRRRPAATGLVFLALFAIFVVALFNKSAILTTLKPGDTVVAEFPRQYKLREYRSKVKLAGAPVGVVSGIEKTRHGTVAVSLKLDKGTVDKLGSAPAAEIRPITVLGGEYYVSLIAGGDHSAFTGHVIPMQRTRVPVELDTLLRAVPPDAQKSLQKTTALLDKVMRAGAGEPLQGVLREAPGTLQPAGVVLDAARGTRPDTDLTQLVTDLNRTAQVLTKRDGQLGAIVDSLAHTSRVLADESQPLADTLATMPATLRLTRTGAQALSGTLDRLTTTAKSARPTVQELDPLLRRLDPALAEVRPLMNDLRPLLAQARPVVEQLVPTTQQGTRVLEDVRGPVLDRINGPIIRTIMSEWHGQGPKYPNGGGNGNKFYQELAYMFTNFNNASKFFDQNGGLVRLSIGLGANSIVNMPGGLDVLLDRLQQMYGPPHQSNRPEASLGSSGESASPSDQYGLSGRRTR